jgi:putative endonuclease
MEHAKGAPKKAKTPARAKATNETPVDAAAFDEKVDETSAPATTPEDVSGEAKAPEESSAEDQSVDSLAEPEAESPEGMTVEPEPSEEPPAESCEDKLSPHELGRRGEQAARAFLRRRGLEIVATNWTCPAGEVDIVASDDHELRFIEVKTRRGTGKGFPEEAVDKEKQRKYERIAEYFLQGYESTELSIHFDVIGIITTAPDRAFLRYHRDAFSAC